MTGEYTPEVLAELESRIASHLHRWNLAPDTTLTLLNVSENATFSVSEPNGREWVLRVHRIGYSSVAEIRSELAWIDALRRDRVIETAAPVPGSDGEPLQRLAGAHGMAPRLAVMFERLPGKQPGSGAGSEPGTEARTEWFERLGEATARMHGHARSWRKPAGFQRKRWDVDGMVGPLGYWGPWRAAEGLRPSDVAVVDEAVQFIRRQLEAFGTGPDRFGLVHADLRLANLLVEGTHLRIIDFDDCGFSWFVYDFAAAVSFIEHEPIVGDLLRAWARGYGRVSPLDPAAEAQIPALVVLRRILLTAWLASHAEVAFASGFRATYTAGTVRLADALLRGDFLRTKST